MSSLGGCPVVTGKKRRNTRSGGPDRATAEGLEALLDYAIVEGAELRRPLFVFLLRLARLALREDEEEAEERDDVR